MTAEPHPMKDVPGTDNRPFSYCPVCGERYGSYESGGHMRCPKTDIEFTVVRDK